MKKLAILCGLLGSLALLAGNDLPINGDFKLGIDKTLYGWKLADDTVNKAASYEVVTHWFSDDNQLKLKSGSVISDFYVYNGEPYLKLEGKAKGSGEASFGVGFYDKDSKLLGTYVYKFNLAGKKQKYKLNVNLNRFFAQNKLDQGQAAFCRLILSTTGQAVFGDFEAELDR